MKALLVALIAFASAFMAGANEHASSSHKTKIVLVGDSTVTDNAGWGLGFKQFLTDGAECINTSQGGRSSESFRREGRWTNALALKGDYYLIQFGHNNEPGKPGRSTDMPKFVSNMVSYVEEARAIGAKPVLVTPLTRRQWDKANPGKIKSSLAPYADEVRKIAAEKKVPLVDLQARSIELCESLGPEKCLEFSPPKIVDGTNTGGFDGTHLNAKGYVMFARLVVDELRKNAPELTAVLRNEPANANPVATEARFDAVVSADGSGTHTTVQAAVDASPTNTTKPFVILVKPGRYLEHVFVPASRPFITLRGEPDDVNQTVITDGVNVKTPTPGGKTVSTRDSSTVLVQGANFTAENITFENTTTREDKVQALAMYAEADRAVFRNCRFLGWQDTLRADASRGGSGRQYYADCYIEGHVDFIYAGGTAVFDRCHIHVKADGYITAASTPESSPFGYVFLDCKITAGSAVEKGFYLGRPWRPFAATAFVRCELPAQVRPEGWHNWGNATNELTARYAEYNSTGPGANFAGRVKWAKQLTSDEAKDYTVEKILAGKDGWSPIIRK
ncbi:MAG: pectinesterase family protein [Verrucomicrobiota bacterium]